MAKYIYGGSPFALIVTINTLADMVAEGVDEDYDDALEALNAVKRIKERNFS
jgi:hypothetical protein